MTGMVVVLLHAWNQRDRVKDVSLSSGYTSINELDALASKKSPGRVLVKIACAHGLYSVQCMN